MIIFICILIIVLCIGVKPRKNNQDVLDKDTTTSINGVFAVLIFLSHIASYINLDDGILNTIYSSFRSHHYQLVVVTFLCFSGYGVMEQIKKGGEDYIRLFPVRRIFLTLLHFDIAVLLFVAVQFCLYGTVYPLWRIAKSFVALSDVGNSNWYIFTILLLYIFTWIAYQIKKRYRKLEVPVIVGVFSLAYIVVWNANGLDSTYISTVLCYSLGMFVSFYKDKVFNMISKHKFPVIYTTCLTVWITYYYRADSIIMNIHSVAFVFFIIVMLSFIKPGNKVLMFLGKYSFGIYILQRLPMMVLINYISQWYYLVPVCFIVTLVIAILFEKVNSAIDKCVLKKINGTT